MGPIQAGIIQVRVSGFCVGEGEGGSQGGVRGDTGEREVGDRGGVGSCSKGSADGVGDKMYDMIRWSVCFLVREGRLSIDPYREGSSG